MHWEERRNVSEGDEAGDVRCGLPLAAESKLDRISRRD